MALSNEKTSVEEIDVNPKHMTEHGSQSKVESVDYAVLTEGERPQPFSKIMLRLWTVVSVGYFVSTMNGYDGSLMVISCLNLFV